jgi:hypothetical protein
VVDPALGQPYPSIHHTLVRRVWIVAESAPEPFKICTHACLCALARQGGSMMLYVCVSLRCCSLCCFIIVHDNGVGVGVLVYVYICIMHFVGQPAKTALPSTPVTFDTCTCSYRLNIGVYVYIHRTSLHAYKVRGLFALNQTW